MAVHINGKIALKRLISIRYKFNSKWNIPLPLTSDSQRIRCRSHTACDNLMLPRACARVCIQ